MYMFFFAKSKQLKALGKVGIIPALFGINEPVLFGVPIVMNPMLAVPFIGMPVIACFNPVFCTVYRNLPIIWSNTDPMDLSTVISGFLLGGWKKCFASVSDPLCFILCLSAIH